MPYLRIQVLCENIKFVQVKYVALKQTDESRLELTEA
jgi:hypothetical protein